MSRYFASGFCFDPTYRPGTRDPHAWRRAEPGSLEAILDDIDWTLELVAEYADKRKDSTP